MSKLHIVLVEPEIPQNTGNIARTCAAIGAALHLVKPLGFDISEKAVKRAGLDYWDKVEIYVHENMTEYEAQVEKESIQVLLSTKSQKVYTEIDYTKYEHIYLIFGPETRGLNEQYILDNFERAVRIPMREGLRSLNLSNGVAIVAYEVERQLGFGNLQEKSMYFEK